MGSQDKKSGGDQEECGVCDGFRGFTADQTKKVKKSSSKRDSASTSAAAINDDSSYNTNNGALPCPPDSRQLGRHTWTFLHTMAAYYPDSPTEHEQKNAARFMKSFAKLYPCSYCAQHLQGELRKSPPKVSSSKEFSQWMCEVHNEVNERLGKPQFDCSKVFERWRTGCRDK